MALYTTFLLISHFPHPSSHPYTQGQDRRSERATLHRRAHLQPKQEIRGEFFLTTISHKLLSTLPKINGGFFFFGAGVALPVVHDGPLWLLPHHLQRAGPAAAGSAAGDGAPVVEDHAGR